MKSKFLSLVFAVATAAALSAGATASAGAQMSEPPIQAPAPSAPLSPEELQQLVAPIALYPDTLVAQILAAASYPTQIVEAQRFLEQNQGLTGEALGNAVNAQDWAPSVKALTEFPQVLSDMNQNLSWTSELGDANYNQPEDVLNAIQEMRQQAQQAGNLQSTAQQTVDDANGGIQIEPADPDEVYVPQYDPQYVYGFPVDVWPGMYPWWPTGGAYMSFGYGVPMGPWHGYGWGCRHWRLGWGDHPGVWYGRDRWRAGSRSFYDRRQFEHGQGFYAGRGEYGASRPGMPSGYSGDYRVGNGGSRREYGQFRPGMPSGANGGVITRGSRGYGERGASGGHGGYYGGGGNHGGGGYHGGGSHGGGGGHGGGGHGGGR